MAKKDMPNGLGWSLTNGFGQQDVRSWSIGRKDRRRLMCQAKNLSTVVGWEYFRNEILSKMKRYMHRIMTVIMSIAVFAALLTVQAIAAERQRGVTKQPREVGPPAATTPPPTGQPRVAPPRGGIAPPPVTVTAGPPLSPLSVLPGEFVITTQTNNYLTANGGGGRITNAVSTNVNGVVNSVWQNPGTSEKFRLVVVDPLNFKYAIQTANGNYLTAVNGGGLSGPDVLPGGIISDVLHTDATQIRAWEVFRLVRLGPADGGYAIQTASGNYLTALGGGGKTTDAFHTDATQIRGWELFFPRKCGDPGPGTYRIKDDPYKGFLYADRGGGQVKDAIRGIRTSPAGWDYEWLYFKLWPQGDGTYALQTVDGHYVTAIRGGGLAHGEATWDNLVTDRTQVQAWEKFRVVDQGNCMYTIQTVSGYYLGPTGVPATYSTAISNINYASKFELYLPY